MDDSKQIQRRLFIKRLGLLVGGSLAPSLGFMRTAQAFIANSIRRARKTTPTLFAWGFNGSNILTVSPAGVLSSPVLANTKIWSKICADGYNSVGITTDGALWTWGLDTGVFGTAGDGTNSNLYSSPVRIGSNLWSDCATDGEAVLAIRQDGTLWGWGCNSNDIFPTNSASAASSDPINLTGAATWLSVSVNNTLDNGSNTIGVDNSGNGYGFGANNNAQLGQGDTDPRWAPVPVPSAAWKYAAVGTDHAIGISTAGTLWTWGLATSGALGNGDLTSTIYNTPAQVGTNSTWSQAAAGNACSLMIRTAGTLWFTGAGANGTSGRGNVNDVSTPLQVGGAATWAKVCLMERHALASKTDGTIWSWGSNSSGEVGIGSASPIISTPVKIGTLTTWTEISAGYYSSGAIKNDGTLWTWGSNSSAQLGLGHTTDVSTPVRVGLTTWSKISMGHEMTAAIRSDGTLWTWGSIGGFWNTEYASTPVQIGSETVWSTSGPAICTYVCLKMMARCGLWE